MGATGLTQATQYAILNANYIARRLETTFPSFIEGTLVSSRTSAF